MLKNKMENHINKITAGQCNKKLKETEIHLYNKFEKWIKFYDRAITLTLFFHEFIYFAANFKRINITIRIRIVCIYVMVRIRYYTACQKWCGCQK